MTKYNFRHRFVLASVDRLPHEAKRIVLIPSLTEGDVYLEALDPELKLQDSCDLCLRGQNFSSPEAAADAADAARSLLERTFASLGIAADFGDRRASGSISLAMVDSTYQAIGMRAYNDKQSLLVYPYEEGIKAVFIATSVDAFLTKGLDTFQRAIEHSAAHELVSQRERLAYDLFSASSFVSVSDARFILLMMALEMLIDQKDREEIEILHIKTLINKTSEAVELDKSTRDSLIGTLEKLTKESVGTAGRRLVERLGVRKYGGMSAKGFFGECYRVRGKLVHGESNGRPTIEEVNLLTANLESLVGELIAGPALMEAVLSQ